MAKHPVPKRRATKTRGDRREHTWTTLTLKRLTKIANFETCPNCGEACQSHTVCPSCGKYRQRLVIDFAAKQNKKIKKVKAT